MELMKGYNHGVWDLTRIDSIPRTAIVESIEISWSCNALFNFNISNTCLALFNEKNSGAFIDTETNYSFWGEPVKQMWSWSTHKKKLNKVKPNLIIGWYDPVSGESGSVELIVTEEERHHKEDRLNERSLLDGGVYLMKVTNSYHHTINVSQRNTARKSFKQHLKDKLSGQDRDEFIRSEDSIILDSDPIQLVNTNLNAITIQKGIVYSLGLVNGRPLNVMLLKGGGLDTNFNPRFSQTFTDSSEVTDEQQRALEVFKSYSKNEHREAGQRTSIFGALAQLSQGIRDGESINRLDQFQYFEAFADAVGLDLNRPFSVNGAEYLYRGSRIIENN